MLMPSPASVLPSKVGVAANVGKRSNRRSEIENVNVRGVTLTTMFDIDGHLSTRSHLTDVEGLPVAKFVVGSDVLTNLFAAPPLMGLSQEAGILVGHSNIVRWNLDRSRR